MIDYTLLKTCSASVYYDVITDKGTRDDEAAYYLLTHRLSRALRKIYDYYGFGLSDDYNDTIDDFYLYLYEGHPNAKPFAMLGFVRSKDAFFGWVLSTYRNFLLKRAREEEKRKAIIAIPSVDGFANPEQLSDETMTTFLATAIAYADQHFTLRNRFIFYRMLLTVLDHNMAIPQEAMSKVLEMNPVTYRVSTNRQKDRFLRLITELEAGKTLDLDDRHREMRNQIIKGFEGLYEVLLRYYETTLQDLPTAAEIKVLRQKYWENDELLMHDTHSGYGFRYKLDVKQLYNNLKTAWGC